MDAWDADFREPNEDERTARRILSLAIGFINARRPLSTKTIRSEYYEEMSDGTFKKTFSRDRARLLMAGLKVKGSKRTDGARTWELDAESSFAKESQVTAEDALTLDLLLLPLASDPSFPYARDLRLALTKIDRSFDGFSFATIPPEARRRNNNLSRLEDCMSAEHAAQITYTRADGDRSTRIVAPLGFFFLRDHTYMVAMRLDGEDGAGPHTYRLDRVGSVKPLPRTRYERPDDFDVRDFIVLPFQTGDKLYDATFVDKDGTALTEWVSKEDIAAAWAIAEGLRPTDPPSLASEWRRKLQHMAGDSHDEE